ncbi:MAG: hypothetical protein N3E47_03090 [Candidatus Bathyarchaeota archaeon]|nr:hypothetical protein [Candidatus Bathyarchaeota archaeon]
MNRFRSSKRGQFIILAAIIIAAFMFSLVLTISQLGTSRLEVSYEPVDELVLTIASDFERSMARALAKATQKYSETGDISSAGGSGEEFIQEWLRATLESYSGFGVNIFLAPENSSGRNVGWDIEWGEGRGKSVVYTTFGIDVEAYDLRNLAMTSLKAVYLDIVDAEVKLSSARSNMTILFRVQVGGKGRNTPISDLTQDNIVLLANGTKDVAGRLIDFRYMGQGIYEALFNSTGLIAESFTLKVTTNDDIIVAANLYTCTLTLMSDNMATPNIVDNGGTLTVNGTTSNPPYILSLFQAQSLKISFTPPEGNTSIGFSSSGPINLTRNGNTAMVNVFNYGSASIVALYNSSRLTAPTACYINLTSREYGGNTVNKGTFTIKFPNGTSHKSDRLPVNNLPVPYNQTLEITYNPDFGYIFRNWEIQNRIIIGNTASLSTKITALSNGTITAVYEKSRPPEWRIVYISPEEKHTDPKKEKEFILKLVPVNGTITPRLNNPHDKRSGNTTETTPMLFLGDNINIALYAKYTKNDGAKKGEEAFIDVKVTLGFFTGNKFYEIGSRVIRVPKSNQHLQYNIAFQPKISVIPAGSILSLILERVDDDIGGTLHILCGSGGSRIILW